MKVSVDEMYYWLDDDPYDIVYGTYSVKNLCSQKPRMEDGYVAGYAKENGM